MSDTCQAIIGFLVPRRSCRNLAETHCNKCKTAICYEHTQVETAGTLCLACALPTPLSQFKLEDDVYFSEDDLLNFAETHRKQAKARGDWIDFT